MNNKKNIKNILIMINNITNSLLKLKFLNNFFLKCY